MTDQTYQIAIRKRSVPHRLRYASHELLEILNQIARCTGDPRGTLLGIAGILERTAGEIEQHQADTDGEYLALAQHTDTTCEAAAALARLRALHTHNRDAGYCNLCSDHGDIGWPCATIAALDKEK